jgi:hypothetical protein
MEVSNLDLICNFGVRQWPHPRLLQMNQMLIIFDLLSETFSDSKFYLGHMYAYV